MPVIECLRLSGLNWFVVVMRRVLVIFNDLCTGAEPLFDAEKVENRLEPASSWHCKTVLSLLADEASSSLSRPSTVFFLSSSGMAGCLS
uniref:Uncharacterized protein n=1 Tax=Rhipicephalus appendiculatus TaxID=34631 RepID=A0A131YD47_RHIAP